MNDLVVSFINEFGNKPNNRNHYFKFIFGDENIFRVIANGGQVNIGTKCSKYRYYLYFLILYETIDMKNYIKIIFNGEFFIIQRLHNTRE